jgi:hypothetical protein
MPPESPWKHFRLLVLPSVLATLPVWIAARPPMIDVPQFAAQVKLFDDLRTHDFPFRELFVVDLFTPYLLGYVLAWPLAQLVGLVASVKIVLAVALASLPLVASRLFERNGGDAAWAWLVVPAGYGFCFNWGFINFLLALPLGLWLLDGSARFVREPRLAGAVVLALAVHLLFFSHLLALLFFGPLAGAIALREQHGRRRRWVALLPLASVAPVTLAWGLTSLSNEAQARGALRWDLDWSRPAFLFTYMLGEDPDFATILVGTALFVLPLLGGARVSREPRRWMPFVACLFVSLFAPDRGGGAYFLYQRFSMLLVPLFLFALDAAENRVRLRAAVAELAGVTVAVTWIAVAILRCAVFDGEARDFDPVLARMETGRRTLSVVRDPLDGSKRYPVFLHYPVWYEVLRDGLVDFNFAENYNEPVRYRDPRQRDAVYDYLILRDDASAPTPLPDFAAGGAKLLLRSGAWSLFEVGAPIRRPAGQ